MKKHITAFYLETLALVLAFLGVLLVLTQVFGAARAQSEQAGRLTEAVGIAERAAEAVAAADSLEDVRALLGGDGNTFSIQNNCLTMEAKDLRLVVTWEPDSALVRSRIAVYWNGAELYSLQTAKRGEAVS